MIVLKMVLKEKSSEVGKSTSELANHTSKSNLLAQIDLKVNNADVEKTTKNFGHKKSSYLDGKKTRKESVTASWRKVVHNVIAKPVDFAFLSWESYRVSVFDLHDWTHVSPQIIRIHHLFSSKDVKSCSD